MHFSHITLRYAALHRVKKRYQYQVSGVLATGTLATSVSSFCCTEPLQPDELLIKEFPFFLFGHARYISGAFFPHALQYSTRLVSFKLLPASSSSKLPHFLSLAHKPRNISSYGNLLLEHDPTACLSVALVLSLNSLFFCLYDLNILTLYYPHHHT